MCVRRLLHLAANFLRFHLRLARNSTPVQPVLKIGYENATDTFEFHGWSERDGTGAVLASGLCFRRQRRRTSVARTFLLARITAGFLQILPPRHLRIPRGMSRGRGITNGTTGFFPNGQPRFNPDNPTAPLRAWEPFRRTREFSRQTLVSCLLMQAYCLRALRVNCRLCRERRPRHRACRHKFL